MRIHLIGANGFIGKEVMAINDSHELISWSHSHLHNDFDLFDSMTWDNLLNSSPESVILLSWPGLPNYDDDFHITRNLPHSVKLIRKLVENGCKNILITGTCYEYGLSSGALVETLSPEPINPYAVAKDCLRRYTQQLCRYNNVRWIWTRIFYTYGINQNSNSLYPSLLRAISECRDTFSLSSGNQMRDFIPASKLADMLLTLISGEASSGIYNCGSGVPISIYDFAQSIVSAYSGSLRIESNHSQSRNHEPQSFWADMNKFKQNSLKA